MSTPVASSSTSATPAATAPAYIKPVTPQLPVIKQVVRLSREEEEKKKKEDALARKRAVDDRFKNRNKKRVAGGNPEGANAEKRAKEEKNLTPYEREVLEINKKMGLSDGGAGVRSLVK